VALSQLSTAFIVLLGALAQSASLAEISSIYPTVGQVEVGLDTAAVGVSSLVKSTYDVIVIGAGFVGLTAGRDLSRSGLRTLLIEARDRIGGRTYMTTLHGHNIEWEGHGSIGLSHTTL
jgi:hypothetical protein